MHLHKQAIRSAVGREHTDLRGLQWGVWSGEGTLQNNPQDTVTALPGRQGMEGGPP